MKNTRHVGIRPMNKKYGTNISSSVKVIETEKSNTIRSYEIQNNLRSNSHIDLSKVTFLEYIE